MVSQDILGGLKVALAKGKSLEETMQAFYNAGYPKEEIEEAARMLNQPPAIPQSQAQQPMQKKMPVLPGMQVKPTPQLPPPVQQPAVMQPKPVVKQPSFQPLSQRPVQRQVVSSYDHKPSTFDPITVILVIILLVLLGVLAAVFFYRDQLISFLNQYLE